MIENMYERMCRISDGLQHTLFNLPPDNRVVSMHHIVNTQKGLTLLWVGVLVVLCRHTESVGYVYMGLHGGYGIVWIIKDYAVPDMRFRQQVSVSTATLVCILLLMYWYIPVATILNSREQRVGGERECWAVLSTIVGVCMMIGSDTQKYVQLKYKKGLVSDGFFRLTRNPNYLGEIMIYGGFGILSNDTVCWCMLLVVWAGLFGTGMMRKELSYMKKDGWREYSDASLILLPRITRQYHTNYIIYSLVLIVSYTVYCKGGVYSYLI